MNLALVTAALGMSVPQPPTPVPSAWNLAKLAAIAGIQHGVLLQHGHEVISWGDANRTLDWASCCRTWLNVVWGWRGALDWLEQPVADLRSNTAITFPADVKVKHLLSYTSKAKPPGSSWAYSCGDHWPKQHAILHELSNASVAELLNQHVLSVVGGSSLRAEMQPDGTCRVKGSCRDQARLARLLLDGGVTLIGHRLLEAEYVRRSTAGGPDGDGQPFHVEGFQTHLIRGGQAWEYQHGELANVPDGFSARDGSDTPDHGHGAIAGFPGDGIVFAYRGADLGLVLPRVFDAREL